MGRYGSSYTSELHYYLSTPLIIFHDPSSSHALYHFNMLLLIMIIFTILEYLLCAMIVYIFSNSHNSDYPYFMNEKIDSQIKYSCKLYFMSL